MIDAQLLDALSKSGGGVRITMSPGGVFTIDTPTGRRGSGVTLQEAARALATILLKTETNPKLREILLAHDRCRITL